MITIKDIKKSFSNQIVLDEVSLDIAHGEMIAVVGPSGTGKSVLLKIITGLLDADGGEVLIDGESITEARTTKEKQAICEKMGVLFQNAALFDSISLFDNVCFPLRYRTKLSESEIIKRSTKCLDEVGLGGYELALPGEVSIGIRKRVGIARALVTEPEVVLFDEPNTGLDPYAGQEIYDLIIETQRISGFTGIVVSHEIPEVFQVCTRVAMLYDGKIQLDSTVHEFLESDLPVVKQFREGSVVGPIEI